MSCDHEDNGSGSVPGCQDCWEDDQALIAQQKEAIDDLFRKLTSARLLYLEVSKGFSFRSNGVGLDVWVVNGPDGRRIIDLPSGPEWVADDHIQSPAIVGMARATALAWRLAGLP